MSQLAETASVAWGLTSEVSALSAALLVDAAGRLVGIDTMVVGGPGVAIPAVTVQRFVDRARASRAA